LKARALAEAGISTSTAKRYEELADVMLLRQSGSLPQDFEPRI
jgi:hypothetical protein